MKNIQRTIRLSDHQEQLIMALAPTFSKGLERALEGAETLSLLRFYTIRELYGLFTDNELDYLSKAVLNANVTGTMRLNPVTLILVGTAYSENMPDDNTHGVPVAQRIRSLNAGQTEAVFCMLESLQSK